MGFTYTAITDIASAALDFYVRGDALSQTMQDKPLLAWLRSNQETFPGGKAAIKQNVQGGYRSDTEALDGYTTTDQLTFTNSMNILQTSYDWKEIHYGLVIAWTEFKQDGITINDKGGKSQHSRAELHRITSMIKNRLDDFMESYSRLFNKMCWQDGSQDAAQPDGVDALIPLDPATATVGGLAGATYSWWRNRALVGANKITASAATSTLTKKLRSELRQLRRYGGKPSKVLCGSAAIEALELELHEKGYYTDSGFTNAGKNDIGMAEIKMRGLGTFEYDPTLDDLGKSKFIYVMDGRRLKLRPMEGEDNRVINPTRPYDYLVFLESLLWTGGITQTQMNAHGVYEVA